MKVIEQHTTPDGLLRFIVEDYGNDIALGFDGFPWHTHPECLPPYDSKNWKFTVKKFVEDLLADRLVIGLCRKSGQLTNAWVVEKPAPDKYKPADEEIEFRYWSGRKYENPIR
jgi:hypothetical protein